MNEDQPQPAAEKDGRTPFETMQRHLGGLTANVDQLAAEQSRNLEAIAMLAFVVGMLAAIVAIQGRQVKVLTNAVAR